MKAQADAAAAKEAGDIKKLEKAEKKAAKIQAK